MRTFTSAADLKDSEGQEVGVSDWHEVPQSQIDLFAQQLYGGQYAPYPQQGYGPPVQQAYGAPPSYPVYGQPA